MDKQKITLFALSGAGGAILIALAAVLYLSVSNMAAAHKARDKAYSDFEAYYRKPVFPNRENIDIRKADIASIDAWTTNALARIQKGDIEIKDETIVGFKTRLQEDVRTLAGTSGAQRVKPGLTFGFDYYLGLTNEMPREENIPRLARQLAYIDQIARILFTAGITQLTSVTREEFDRTPAAGDDSSPRSTRRTRRPSYDDAETTTPETSTLATAPLPPPIAQQLQKETLIFEFEAGYPTLATALNDLTKADLFTAVTDLRIIRGKTVQAAFDDRTKLLDSLHSRRKSDPPPAAPATEIIGMRPQDRIVTNPETDPPLKVVMKVDVYALKGANRAN